jgi:ribonuclease HI
MKNGYGRMCVARVGWIVYLEEFIPANTDLKEDSFYFELQAVKEAIEIFIAMGANQGIIYTDARSVTHAVGQASASWNSEAGVVKAMMREHRIKLEWAPRHSNTAGQFLDSNKSIYDGVTECQLG